MKKIIVLALMLVIPAGINSLSGCTSVIISGKYTPDGRPVMWKHRDTSSENNKLLYFTQGKYEYIGVVSTGRGELKSVWMGMNSEGFCIMNTASYNINPDPEVKGRYGEGSFMKLALGLCSSLEDFEKMLDTISTPSGLSANFGVIDANGGAAYYEVGHYDWTKYDVNDPKLAPLGYMIRTNYSFNGDPETGQGHARYITASDIFYRKAMENDMTVEAILREAERSLVNGFTGTDLADLATDENSVRLVHFKDNIARLSSTSSAVFHGVKAGEDPMSTVMWTVSGWPLATVAYPVWMNKDHILPSLLTAPEGENAVICDAGLKAKREATPVTRGHGKEYLNINKVYNNNNTGYMQWIRPLEDSVFSLVRESRTGWHSDVPDVSELKILYGELDKLIIREYEHNGFQLTK